MVTLPSPAAHAQDVLDQQVASVLIVLCEEEDVSLRPPRARVERNRSCPSLSAGKEASHAQNRWILSQPSDLTRISPFGLSLRQTKEREREKEGDTPLVRTSTLKSKQTISLQSFFPPISKKRTVVAISSQKEKEREKEREERTTDLARDL